MLGRGIAAAVRTLRWVWLALVLYLCIVVVLPAVLGATTAAYYAEASPVAALTKMSRLLLTYCGLGAFQPSAVFAVLLAGAVTAVVVTIFLWAGNRRGLWAVIWTLSTLVLAAPFSDIALRHNYLPLVGFWMTVALLGDELVGGGDIRGEQQFPSVPDRLFSLSVLLRSWCSRGCCFSARSTTTGTTVRFIANSPTLCSAVEPRLPRDQPFLFVNNGKRRAVEESIGQLQGVEKTFFLRRDALWQLVYLPSLANFLGDPFAERLRPVRADEISTAGLGGFTVLDVQRQGVSVRYGCRWEPRFRDRGLRSPPTHVSWYRFEPN